MRDDTIASLRGMLEHAPRDPGRIAPELRGWQTPDGVAVCARCAGRIMGRGCALPRESTPIFYGEAATFHCDLHN